MGPPDKGNSQVCSILCITKCSPTEKNQCKRGIRQGDPLSPLLSVLAADILQLVLNKAVERGLLQHPLDLPHTRDFPVIQYEDDTIEESQR
jgi:hypothetical protein